MLKTQKENINLTYKTGSMTEHTFFIRRHTCGQHAYFKNCLTLLIIREIKFSHSYLSPLTDSGFYKISC